MPKVAAVHSFHDFSGGIMVRSQRFLPNLLVMLLPLGVLVSGCGKAPEIGKTETAEKNSRDDGGGAPPAGVPEDQPARSSDGQSSSPAASSQSEKKGADETSPGEEKSATSDGDDGRSRGITAPPKTAKPPAPSPTTQPPPPPAAEVKPPAGGGEPGAFGVGSAASDKKFDVVPVFYGTDRAVEPDEKRLKFGSDRGHQLKLGRALITVPTAHKVPNIERPWVIEIPYFKVKIYEETEDPAKHFTLQELNALTKEEMLAFIKTRLAASKKFKDHALVFVHGFNTSFDAALYRTAQISYDLKFDGAPFVYSWPSGGKVASYTYDKGSVEQAEPHLAEFLKMVVKESGAKSISLIAHSMGNELLLRVLERARPVAPEGVVISQVILAAPDVDRDKFDNIAREITSFSKGVTLYAAANDRALSYSGKFWGGVPAPATCRRVVP